MSYINIRYKEFIITTDKTLMQPLEIHKWLSEKSHWQKGVSFEV